MDEIEKLRQNLELEILNLISEIVKKLGYNPYIELIQAMNIVNGKNYNDFKAVQNKMKNLSILLYDRRLYLGQIKQFIDNIELILEKITSMKLS